MSLDEEDTEVIMSEGIIRLCEDLDIDVASDVEILYLAWKCKAAKGAQLTREEFMTGMLALGCVFHSICSFKRCLTTSTVAAILLKG